jgi:uncharacterized membrane protein required for colicin V production
MEMGFSWLDVFLVLVAVALTVWEIRRDLGQSVFDTIALILGLRLAMWLGPILAPDLGMDSINQARGVALLLVFLVASGVGLAAGYYVHRITLWTLDQFDRVSGLLLGFSSAVIVCHVLVASFALMGTTNAGPPRYIKQSFLAQEALTFRTCRQVIGFFNGLRA